MAECCCCNISHTVRQFDRRQTGISKGIGIDSGAGTLRKLYSVQTCTAVECIGTDALYAFFQNDSFQLCTVCKHGRADGSQISGNRDGFQRCTVRECIVADKVQACRQLDVCQVGAGAERTAVNGSHAVRHADTGQIGAAQKCVCTDAHHTVRHGDGPQFLVAVECSRSDKGYRIIFFVLFVINGIRNHQIGGARCTAGDLCLFRYDLVVQLAVLCRLAVRNLNVGIFRIIRCGNGFQTAGSAADRCFHICGDLCIDLTGRHRFFQFRHHCRDHRVGGTLRCCISGRAQTAGDQCRNGNDACNSFSPI